MLPTDWIVAILSVVTAFATAGLVLMAFFAWDQAKETLGAMAEANRAADAASKAAEASSRAQEMANDQARQDSIRQTRPYAYAEVIPGIAGRRTADLRLRNAGQSTASNLTLEFSEWPSERDDVATKVAEMMQTPRALPPGCSLRVVWRIWRGGQGQLVDPQTGEKSDVAGMPENGTITVRYSDDDGHHFVESFPVLLDASGLTPLPGEGSELRGQGRDREGRIRSRARSGLACGRSEPVGDGLVTHPVRAECGAGLDQTLPLSLDPWVWWVVGGRARRVGTWKCLLGMENREC